MCFKTGRVRTRNATILEGNYRNLSNDNNRHGTERSKSAKSDFKFYIYVQISLNLSKEKSMNITIFGTNFLIASTFS